MDGWKNVFARRQLPSPELLSVMLVLVYWNVRSSAIHCTSWESQSKFVGPMESTYTFALNFFRMTQHEVYDTNLLYSAYSR